MSTVPPAVLVGIQLQGVLDEALASSLDELERLTKTLGLRVIGRVTQKRRGLGAANLLGEGKLEELAEYTGGRGFVPRYAVPGSRAALETESFEAELDEEAEDEPRRAVTVIVDHDLSPTQMRNLERATGVEVLDRSMVILSIFQRHARLVKPRSRSKSHASSTRRRGFERPTRGPNASEVASEARGRASPRWS